ncbi:MAG: hypothetical protein ABI641_16610 [Caldimonas sp.]
MIYLDADSRQAGYEDVHSKITLCRARCAGNGLGVDYVDRFAR